MSNESSEDVDHTPEQRRALCIYGAAGTGKSFVMTSIAQLAHSQNLRVAITGFAALLADSYRNQCPFATCQTVHSLLGFHGDGLDPTQAAARLFEHDVILVDEIGMLPKELFDYLFTAWVHIERWPLLVLGGDTGQLTPFDDSGTLDVSNVTSRYWGLVDKLTLTEPIRADDSLWPLLQVLRHNVPSKQCLRELTCGRIWHEGEVTHQCIRELFERFPNTTLVSISRASTSKLNDLAQQATAKAVSAADLHLPPTFSNSN